MKARDVVGVLNDLDRREQERSLKDEELPKPKEYVLKEEMVKEMIVEQLKEDRDKLDEEVKGITTRSGKKLRRSRVEQRGEIFKDTMYGTKVTIPFTELVRLTPGYARYIKDMIKENRVPKDVHGIEEVNGILEKGDEFITPKLEDPGSFFISCKIGNKISCDCLADLGASINLMPWSVYTKLSNAALDTTMMTIMLADQTFQRPLGKTHVVIVTVGDLHFQAEFVVMNIPEDKKVPIILGRPFLNTAKAVIEVAECRITIGNGLKDEMKIVS
uniref:uncharacterized protein LOC122585880 n=1 Tax=Erigeron canadensis TaxID=72917 RepID=UPI001CB8AD6E|nr:uncharacterized protein LOC122585880 [Erigeron canadensis]